MANVPLLQERESQKKGGGGKEDFKIGATEGTALQGKKG